MSTLFLIPQVVNVKDPNQLTTFCHAVQIVLNGLINNGQLTRTAQDTYITGGGGGPTLPVASGGTGRATLTNHSILIGAGTSPVNFAGPGSVLTVLAGSGPSADPVFTDSPTVNAISVGSPGSPGAVSIWDDTVSGYGTILLDSDTYVFDTLTSHAGTLAPSFFSIYGSASGRTFITTQAAAGNFNFNLPTTAGSSGDVLTSAAGGTNPMTWTTPAFLITSAETVVNGSTSGTATYSQPFQGAHYKKAIVYLNALLGTASYTFPTAFTHTPQILTTNGPAAALVTSLSASAVTITGTTSTGYIILEGS